LWRFDPFQRFQVPQGRIDGMDEVPHASLIRGRVVIAPKVERLSSADYNLGYIKQKIVRNALGVGNQAAFVCANRVEIAQYGDTPIGNGTQRVAQHIFNDEFGVPVWALGW